MALRKMPGGKSDICLMRLKICEIVEDLVLYKLANFGKTKMKT